ncbi:MAG: hypothetical protein H6607_00370 [Flavobacteriales bacterium]|nr:hypothetical protein [Flavobacteriales bacterium]
MNYQVWSYGMYFLATGYITIIVGYGFYKNGFALILDLFSQNHQAANAINKILLMGYYLINLGYVALSIRLWPPISNVNELLAELFYRVGTIMLILGLMHLNNVVWLYILSKSKKFIHYITH